jgi:hypothetical protein
VKQLANKKVTNGIAKNWIAKELEMKRRVWEVMKKSQNISTRL